MKDFISILEFIGTVAFAISGAMVAIQKGMDLLGVVVLGVVTAVGGGIIRDLILGNTPPNVFQSPRCAGVSIITSLIVFGFVFLKRRGNHGKIKKGFQQQYDAILMLSDTVGLGIFTVMGIQVAIHTLNEYSGFLLVFVGSITGVGGGVLRDMMCGEIPYIFKKHVYATASIIGCLGAIAVWEPFGENLAMVAGSVIVIVIRYLAAHYSWNLPRIAARKNDAQASSEEIAEEK